MGAEQPPGDVLRSAAAGAIVIRGGVIRAGAYFVGAALGAVTSVFLLRALGVEDFGRYATVAALLAIVSTLSDAGLTAVGTRDLALRTTHDDRARLLGNLVGLRIGVTLVAIALGAAFALAVGYERVLVAGVLLGGLGVLLVNTQAMMMAPLSVDLRIGTVAVVEVVKSVVTLVGVAALALAGAALLPYFGVQVLVGLAVLALTPRLVGAGAGLVPRITATQARTLLRDAAPVALALAMNVLYLRLLVVIVSLVTGETETGLYGTAFRVVELFVAIPPLVIGAALPLLAVAGAEDLARLRYAVQRLTEIVVVAALGLALVVTVVAEPALRLLGGAEYEGAAAMLQIQVWALVPLAVGNVVALALLSLRRQREIAVANAFAVVAVLAAGLILIGRYGGEGAAVTGLVAEAILLVALLSLLARSERTLVPRPGFLWRALVALAAGAATLLVPLPSWVDGAAAAAVFTAVAFAVRAVPPELLDAFTRRARGARR